MNFIIHLFKSMILFIRRRRNWKRTKPKVVVAFSKSEKAIHGIDVLENFIGGMARSAAAFADSLRAVGFAWRHKPAFEPGGYIHEEPQDYDFQEKTYPNLNHFRDASQRSLIHMRCAEIYARMITAENLDLHCLKISLIAEEAKLSLHSAINPEAIADRAVRKARAEELARKGWIVTPEEVVPEFDRLRRRASFTGIGLQNKMPPPTFEI